MRQSLVAPRIALGLMLVILVLPGCASARKLSWNPFNDRIKDRENRYSFAQVMEQNGDIHRAEQNYRKLTEEAPKDARYYQRLGVVLVREGKTEEGITNLQKASDLDKENIAILNDLGYAYTVEGEYERAEKVLRQAMKVDARDVRTQNNLAMALGYMGKTEEAYDLFRRNTDEGTARSNLAYIYAQSGHVDLAMKEYSKALSHSPGNKSAAEAIVQLNTLNRALAASQKTDSKTQIAADRADHAEKTAVRRVSAENTPRDNADLVQLLNEVEPDEEPAQPAAKVQLGRPGKHSLPAADDYDWSASP